MMLMTPHRHHRMATTMVSAALLLAGCGGGSPSAAGDGGSSGSDTGTRPTLDGAMPGDSGSGDGLAGDGTTPINVTADFFVAVDGNDSWSGTLPAPNAAGSDGPFKTLTKAQTAVQGVSRTGRTTPIQVVVRGGTYTLTAPWTFAAADAGTAAVPIVYAAYPGETPVISGGTQLGGWTSPSSGTWTTTTLPASAAFEQLWVDGVRRYRPRVDAGFYLRIVAPTTATTFTMANAGDLSPSYHDISDVELVVFEQWTVSRSRLVSVNATSSVVTSTALDTPSSFHGYIANHRYYADNVKEALSTPGQWYLDRTATPKETLTYLASSGEDPSATTVVVAPVLQQLVVATELAYTTFRGLTFSYTDWEVPAAGYKAGQGLWNVPAALSFTDSVKVVLDGCTVSHVGGVAVEFEGNGAGWSPSMSDPYSNEFINGVITDIGACGLRIGTTPNSTNTETTTAQGVHVANDLITGGGRFLLSGMAVIVGDAHDLMIEHNEISDWYQTAIAVGYTFAGQGAAGQQATYPASLTHDDVIQYNLIHDIGRGVTNDLGGVYTLTMDNTGNVVQNNVIHDIVNDPGGNGFVDSYNGANGIYFDQGTSNVLTKDNLVYRATGAPFQQNMGRKNDVENNILAWGRDSTFNHALYEDMGLWATFKSNIILTDRPTLLAGNYVCPAGDCRVWVDFASNLYWNPMTMSVSFHITQPSATYTLATWQSMESEDLGSILADPLFTNPVYPTDDFTLSVNSPAASIGFVPFDTTTAGRTSAVLTAPPVPDAAHLQEPASPATYY
jgi:hypothetical protein